MDHISEFILDLLKESAAVASEIQSEQLADATVRALDAMGKDSLIGVKDAWVYQSIIHGMVASGALRVEGQDIITPRTPEQG